MNVPLVGIERLAVRRASSARTWVASKPLRDTLARPLEDLRLSVTDRCNFRCVYCMPRSKFGSAVAPLPREQILSFEELTSIARAFVELGVEKIRVTGGEPLVRRELPKLIEQLASLNVRDLCLTTNGSLLAQHAPALASAGLRRVTVSLDALSDETFARMTDVRTRVTSVLEGIDAARRCGLSPVRINMVVQRGVNEHEVLPMANWARREGLELRFIEYMDVGCSNGWDWGDVVAADEIFQRIHHVWPLEALPATSPSETAERYRYVDGRGTIGIIASISRAFCGSCTRARVSSKGELYPCLFAPFGIDLAAPLRQGRDLRPIIAEFWQSRRDRYSEQRMSIPRGRIRPEMSAIGG